MSTVTTDFAQSAPAEALRPYISQYVGFRASGLQPSVHSAVPSRHLGFAISLGDPIQLVRAPGSPAPTHRRAFIVGPSIGPATVAYDDRRDGLFVHLRRTGVFALFGVRAFEMSSSTLDLSVIMGSAYDGLMNRLMTASGWQKRFEALDDVFLQALRPVQTPPELTWAWKALAQTRGCVSIQELAVAVGWTRQHLDKRFLYEFGTSPKTAARIFRFENAIRLIKSGRTGLAHVAAECGYYDQAHMTVEWNAMTGYSPKAWIVRELPFFQYAESFPPDA
jgi:AraC-like DNA-binding protein